MADTEPKKVGIFVDADLHREAKTKVAQLGTSFQQVLLPMLEIWVRGEVPQSAKNVLSAKNQRWHAILDQLLDSADRDQIQIIQQQLLLFERIHNQTAASSPATKTKKVN